MSLPSVVPVHVTFPCLPYLKGQLMVPRLRPEELSMPLYYADTTMMLATRSAGSWASLRKAPHPSTRRAHGDAVIR